MRLVLCRTQPPKPSRRNCFDREDDGFVVGVFPVRREGCPHQDGRDLLRGLRRAAVQGSLNGSFSTLCFFCRGGGFAFAPPNVTPCRDVWIPCPFCDAGQHQTIAPRARAILAELDIEDPSSIVCGLPERPTAQQAKRMVEAIARSFWRGGHAL